MIHCPQPCPHEACKVKLGWNLNSKFQISILCAVVEQGTFSNVEF